MGREKATPDKSQRPRFGDDVASLLDSMVDALILVDRDGTILYFNDEAERAFSISRTVATAHPFDQVLAGNPWLIKLIDRTLRTNSACTDRNATLRVGPDVTGRASEHPVSAAVTPWHHSDGDYWGALVMLSDRSRVRELQRDLIRNDRLASLGTIAAGLAHEIKNPLGGIKGAAQLLEREIKGTDQAELIQVILKESARVNSIVERLLRFGRPPAVEHQDVNLHVVLNEVVQLVALSETGRDKHFEQIYDPSLPHVTGSHDALKQVFLNLIQNAAEASAPEGRIEISTRYTSDVALRDSGGSVRGFLQTSIRDYGCGIDPENLLRLFTPFFTTKEKGTGLGLVMSHQIIKEHGGFLTVESIPGEGTTFLVHLPLGGTRDER